MRVRDRLIVAVLAAVVVVGATWIMLVSPERSQVSSLSTQIATERTSLLAAQGQLASARHATAGYIADIHQINDVTTAVPPSPGEAALITTISKLAGTTVDFHELDVGGNGATASGPVSLGLTFTFFSSYQNLQDFLASIDALTKTNGSRVSATGRLFTVTSVALTPTSPTKMKATITAQAYVQGAVAPAAAAAPAGTTAPAGAAGAVSSTTTPSTAATPAVTG